MKRVFACAVALSVVFGYGLSFGQEAVSPNYEHLRGLECFVGNWVGEAKTPDDSQQKLTIRHTARWILNKSVMEFNWRTRLGGKAMGQGKALLYYDLLAKQVKAMGVGSDGFHSHGVWRKDGNKWIGKSTGADSEGRKTSSAQVFTMVDDNTMTFEITEATANGEPQPGFKAQYTRIKPKRRKREK